MKVIPIVVACCCSLLSQAQIISKAPKAESNADPCKTAMMKKRLAPAPSVIDTANVRAGFMDAIEFKLYRHPDLLPCAVRGVVLLSSYDASYNHLLVDRIARKLANDNFIVAIIKHRGQNGTDDFAGESAKVETDYHNVWDYVTKKYGGTIQKTILGGVSFSGFCVPQIIFHNSQGWAKGLKGIVLIASGTSAAIPVPVINMVCKADEISNSFGNQAGFALQNALNANNATVAAKSTCQTDDACTGHTDHISWINFFVDNIEKWL